LATALPGTRAARSKDARNGRPRILRRIKERRAAVPIIMVTAFASIELAVDAMKLGATDFVRKPMTPEIVRNAVQAALSKTAAKFLRRWRETNHTPLQSACRYRHIERLSIWRAADVGEDTQKNERRFIVTGPSGGEYRLL